MPVIIILPPPGCKNMGWQCAVGRTAVDNDVFDIRVRLGENGKESGFDIRPTVKDCDDDGEGLRQDDVTATSGVEVFSGGSF
jgi:hypothetical protein